MKTGSLPRPVEFLRAARLLRPFLGLLFIVLVLILYDVLFIRDVLSASDWQNYPRGFIPTSVLRALGMERFGLIVSSENLKLIATQTTIVALGALGMTLIIVSGGIDLSPGSSIALGTVVIALCLRGIELPLLGTTLQTGPAAAALAGILVGTAIGLANGVLITRLRVVPFIVTLGMLGIARGLAKWISGEQKVSAPGETWLNDLLFVHRGPDAAFWQLPPGVVVLAALAVLTALVLKYTVFGRYVYVLGSSEPAARLCGIHVERQRVWIYTLAGAFTGVAALMEFSTLNVGDPSGAEGKELQIIAAVVIGGASLSGGRGSVLGTLVGAFIIGILRNGCVLYDIPNTVQEIVIGAIIIAAAGIDQLQLRRRS